MNLLANPILLRAAFLLVWASTAFLMGLLLIRYLHKDLLADGTLPAQSFASGESLPLHAYNAVIQQLKQQKQELVEQNLLERRKAKASETLNTTIMANISCGVVVVDSNGLVRQANPAARDILGFASPIGLHTSDILRGMVQSAQHHGHNNQAFGELLAPALAGKSEIRGLFFDYATPAGKKRVIEVAATPVPRDGDAPSETALVFNDTTINNFPTGSEASLSSAAGA